MSDINPLDRVFEHLAAGEIAAALEWLAPDAQIWHNFDRIAHDREGSEREWKAFVANFPERTFTDVRSQATTNGFVRQHVMTVRTAGGKQLSWEVCVVVVMDGGQIRRLDEYIDRAASFSLESER
ncbi:nuclear transport factor 2 family protein [Novosphingobium sp. G106]|uniref:nuclear transport factor 2 family protein n=1 Tax=Novosphingobium sp. G106 TaxID=2849500 RepID=UPI001C2D58ED|nr:nuclear transport factor 2 family protein [Novosphingobium sp. G106]MBV1687851.1 nuclear transport factor 2 family protein [Novosphingobium sp. G106]